MRGGVDGETPQIGLTQGTNGNWYWALNGELMTDSDGNSIHANGEDDKDGQTRWTRRRNGSNRQ